VRALPIRNQTRFSPPSSHIFLTGHCRGVRETTRDMVWCVWLWWPRGLTHCFSPSRGTFNILELLNGMSLLTIYVTRVQGCSMFTLGDVAHSGSIQLSQGTVVPEVVDSLPVKMFLVLVEALEMAYREDLVD